MSNIKDRVKKIVSEQLNVRLDKVKDDSRFVEDLGADSLDSVELVMALEEEFAHQIDDATAETITSVQLAIDYLEEHVG